MFEVIGLFGLLLVLSVLTNEQMRNVAKTFCRASWSEHKLIFQLWALGLVLGSVLGLFAESIADVLK